MISLIVAASTNNVIGNQGELPWRLSDDLKRFKAVTMGKPIIMGRKTFESIGRALPGRQNIVITGQADFMAEGCDVVGSKEAALAATGDADEVMVIGGSQVYALFHPDAGRLYLTRVHAEIDGDDGLPLAPTPRGSPGSFRGRPPNRVRYGRRSGSGLRRSTNRRRAGLGPCPKWGQLDPFAFPVCRNSARTGLRTIPKRCRACHVSRMHYV